MEHHHLMWYIDTDSLGIVIWRCLCGYTLRMRPILGTFLEVCRHPTLTVEEMDEIKKQLKEELYGRTT